MINVQHWLNSKLKQDGGFFFFHVKVRCLLGQGHYFCAHFGCHHLLKANIFSYLFFHDVGDDDVHGDNDGFYNFHFFVGF